MMNRNHHIDLLNKIKGIVRRSAVHQLVFDNDGLFTNWAIEHNIGTIFWHRLHDKINLHFLEHLFKNTPILYHWQKWMDGQKWMEVRGL